MRGPNNGHAIDRSTASPPLCHPHAMRLTGSSGLSIDERELTETFARASGPGGQNVNKVETAVSLRFDVFNSPSLPEDVKYRLMKSAGRALTQDGVLVIFAQEHRSQDRNREAARARLLALIDEAAIRPRRRRATRPTYGSQLRRLDGKTKRSAIKRNRTTHPDSD